MEPADPVPPWEYRKEEKKSAKVTAQQGQNERNTAMTIEERLEKLERELTAVKAFNEAMLEEYAQKRIAEVVHRLGVQARVGLNQRMKTKAGKKAIQEFFSRPENSEANCTDVRF